MDIRIGYTKEDGSPSNPLPKQEGFHLSGAKFKLYTGGLGAGKTECGVLEGLAHSLECTNNLGLVMRTTSALLRDTTRRTWLEKVPEKLVKRLPTTAENDLILKNGSRIMFRSLIDANNRRNARQFGSYDLGWWHIDEGDALLREEFLILAGRLRHRGAKRLQGFITMNPVNPDSWLWQEFHKDNPDYEHFPSTTYENKENLPEGYIESLEAMYSPEWVKRYLGGEFVFLAEGDPVYPRFSEPLHNTNITFLDDRVVYRGWDFAYIHPAVAFSQIDTRDRLIIEREFMGDKITIDRFTELILYLSNQRYKGMLSPELQKFIHHTELEPFYPPNTQFYDYCDPAGGQRQSIAIETQEEAEVNTDIKVLNSYGIYPEYRKSLVSEGIGIIRHLLEVRADGVPGLLINCEKCPILRQGFLGGYKLRKRGNIVIPDEPYKDGYFDHLQDGLRYKAIHLFHPFDGNRLPGEKSVDIIRMELSKRI